MLVSSTDARFKVLCHLDRFFFDISDVAGCSFSCKPLGALVAATYILSIEMCDSQRVRFSITFLVLKKFIELTDKVLSLSWRCVSQFVPLVVVPLFRSP